MMREHHLPVARTARYYTLGDPRADVQEVWVVCHGYGQLAARFLRHFTPLDDGRRLIVAPEALSRFYVELGGAGGDGRRSHAHMPVGASWMTREDRLSEIDDYIRYLDTLAAQLFQEIPRDAVRVVVLGFSQGVATVCRWIARGSVRADRLILWGGLVPPDLDLEADGAALRAVDLVTVRGDRDTLVSATAHAEQGERLTRHGVPFRAVTYPGGHRIDADVLQQLATASVG